VRELPITLPRISRYKLCPPSCHHRNVHYASAGLRSSKYRQIADAFDCFVTIRAFEYLEQRRFNQRGVLINICLPRCFIRYRYFRHTIRRFTSRLYAENISGFPVLSSPPFPPPPSLPPWEWYRNICKSICTWIAFNRVPCFTFGVRMSMPPCGTDLVTFTRSRRRISSQRVSRSSRACYVWAECWRDILERILKRKRATQWDLD